MKKRAIIISASSDIALAIAQNWCDQDWEIYGTYRNSSTCVEELRAHSNMHWVHCDLLDVNSIKPACDSLIKLCPKWDVLLFATSRQEPVGDFSIVDFDTWEEGIQVNLLRQLKVLHKLLPFRNPTPKIPEPTVLFFAGGGTNNAVVHYSSYTLSKIALTKMVELLDAEMPDVRFSIIGPGWVNTKSHLPTLKLGAKFAGENYQKTLEKLQSNECTPMEKIINCCNWVIETPSKGVKGRNFSIVFDRWGSSELEEELEKDFDMYKLRRNKNSWSPQTKENSSECGVKL